MTKLYTKNKPLVTSAMVFVRIDDVLFLVDDRVEIVSQISVAADAAATKVLGRLFHVENTVLTVNLAVKHAINDRSVGVAGRIIYSKTKNKRKTNQRF